MIYETPLLLTETVQIAERASETVKLNEDPSENLQLLIAAARFYFSDLLRQEGYSPERVIAKVKDYLRFKDTSELLEAAGKVRKPDAGSPKDIQTRKTKLRRGKGAA